MDSPAAPAVNLDRAIDGLEARLRELRSARETLRHPAVLALLAGLPEAQDVVFRDSVNGDAGNGRPRALPPPRTKPKKPKKPAKAAKAEPAPAATSPAAKTAWDDSWTDDAAADAAGEADPDDAKDLDVTGEMRLHRESGQRGPPKTNDVLRCSGLLLERNGPQTPSAVAAAIGTSTWMVESKLKASDRFEKAGGRWELTAVGRQALRDR